MGVIRIAMWSGPRNISTALMRSFESRPDCAVTDEPFYAHYLSRLPEERREEHPAWEAVLAAQPTDWREVARRLTGRPPGGSPVWYQKHMAHHVTGEMETDWVRNLVNCFLIRNPEDMITSFIRVIRSPRAVDLGLPQQVSLFRRMRELAGDAPPVVDSDDILRDPEGVLRALCDRIGIAFEPAMLSWAPGARETDGVWGQHWYANVYESTGFGAARMKDERAPARLRGVLAECNELYDELSAYRIRAMARGAE